MPRSVADRPAAESAARVPPYAGYCLRCSYGAPHRHDADESIDWRPARNLGIAAQGRAPVEKLLKDWAAAGQGRRIEGIETRECDVPARADGHVWWRGPEDEDG